MASSETIRTRKRKPKADRPSLAVIWDEEESRLKYIITPESVATASRGGLGFSVEVRPDGSIDVVMVEIRNRA